MTLKYARNAKYLTAPINSYRGWSHRVSSRFKSFYCSTDDDSKSDALYAVRSYITRFADSPNDPSDTLLGYYLISTWAKLCQAMGDEFEPYLPVVMPPLLQAASAKADISLYGEVIGK